MRCSVDVKLKLSKTFCIMFHDIALWKNKDTILNNLSAGYVKRIQLVFGFHKFIR